MASPPPRAVKPGRTLVIFLLTLVALSGVMFLVDRTPTPGLGLDLQGGTSITLTATQEEGGAPDEEAMATAVEIIRSRVDSTGVAEAEVSTQGSSTIIVAVPGRNPEGLVDLVGTTAELRFRQVLQATPTTPITEPTPSETPSGDPSESPTTEPGETTTPGGTTTPATSEPAATTTAPSTTTSTSAPTSAPSAQLADAVPLAQGTTTGATSPAPTTPATTTPADDQTTPSTTEPTTEPTDEPTEPAEEPTDPAEEPEEAYPGLADALEVFADLDCADPANLQGGNSDDPATVLATCADDGTFKYLLAPATVLGTDITDAVAGLPQGGIGDWEVSLTFNGAGTDDFSVMTNQLVNLSPPTNQFAIVLDSLVQSAPQVINPINDGRARITGQFTQAEATELANVLRYGALPLAFEASDVREVTPTLGADSLRAGLIAGLIGLSLVLIYAMIYYRALGLVIIGSLLVATALTYVVIVLMTEWINFRLTLAGVAGLIVAIGVTADSFIIYFERIRDEVREGRTLRQSIEYGWVRARRTIIAADVVSLLSAIVLYIVSIGNVRGFAFALGLSTVIDVIIVFLFTKPLMSWLGSKKAFSDGTSKWSGFSGDRLGARRSATSTATTASRLSRRRPATAEES